MKTEYLSKWNAFCTMYWFVTGQQIIELDDSFVGQRLYEWYLEVCDA